MSSAPLKPNDESPAQAPWRLLPKVLGARAGRVAASLILPFLFGGLVMAQGGLPPEAPELPGLLVYTRQSDDVVYWDLFTSRGDGQAESQLTETEDDNSRGEDQPRWSPDGEEIAFATFNRDGDEAQIWRMPFDASEPPALVAEAPAPDAGYPAWRPDGEAILYTGPHEGAGPSTLDLKLASLAGDGGISTFLDTADVDERNPDWSPESDLVAYAAYDLSEAGQTQWWDIYVANADGSNPRPLVTRPYSTERFPRFSPDGSQLIYVSFASEVGFGRGTLRLYDMATGDERELVRNVGLPAAWSPDGEYILVYNTVIAGLALPGMPTAEPPAASDPQRFGLYAYRLEDGALFRLKGAAGGSTARANSFKWGQVVDWTGGTYTPTPAVTDTPTPSPTVTASATLPASPTPSATVTRTPTATAVAPPGIYLPIGLRGVAIGEPAP